MYMYVFIHYIIGVMRMASKYSVTLAKLIHDNGLEVVFMPDKPQEELLIRSQDVNRPGLCLQATVNTSTLKDLNS